MIQLKEKIYTIFVELILKDGIRKVTMDSLAAQCGVSKKTIYKYYTSKDQLAKKYINSLIYRIKYDVQNVKDSTDDPHERIIKFYEIIISNLGRAPDSIIPDALKIDPKLGNQVTDMYIEFTNFIMTNIQEGIDKGIFKNITPKVAERFYMGAVQNVFGDEFLKGNETSMEKMIQDFQTLLSSGLLK